MVHRGCSAMIRASTAAAEPKSSVKDRTKDVFGWTVVPSNSKDEAVKIDAVDVVDCISGGPDSEASVTFVEKLSSYTEEATGRYWSRDD